MLEVCEWGRHVDMHVTMGEYGWLCVWVGCVYMCVCVFGTVVMFDVQLIDSLCRETRGMCSRPTVLCTVRATYLISPYDCGQW